MSQHPRHPDDLMTGPEVMQRLRISKRTMDRMIERRTIPPVYVGRHVRFDWSDVRAFIERSKKP